MLLKTLFSSAGFFIATENVFIDFVFFSGYRSLAIIALPTIVVVIFLHRIFSNNPKLNINWIGVSFNVLIVMGILLNHLFHQHPIDYRYFYYLLLTLPLFFFLDIKPFYNQFILGLVVGNGLSILAGITIYFQRFSPVITDYSFGPNGYGFSQALIICIILIELFYSNKFQPFFRKSTLFLGLLCSSYALFVSGSRMAVVGVVISILLGVFLHTNPLRRFFKMSILFISILGIVMFFFHQNPDNKALSNLFLQRYSLELAAETGGSGRMDIYRALFKNLPDEILFLGFGPGGKNRIAELNPFGSETHNLFLEILFEYGLVMLIVFLLYNLSIAISYFRKGMKKYSLLHIPFLIMGLFLHVFAFPFTLLVLSICSNSFKLVPSAFDEKARYQKSEKGVNHLLGEKVFSNL